MSYSGNVSVGGPADSRELPGLTITKVSVGPMDNNAYLLRCTQTGELALIDAANDAQTLLGLVGDAPLATSITTPRSPRCSRLPARRPSPTRTTLPGCRFRLPGRCGTETPSLSATPGCP